MPPRSARQPIHGPPRQLTSSLQIYVFAVNHGRKGESILRFSHKLGSDVLTFEREFTHPLIKSPNAVMPDSLEYSSPSHIYTVPD